MNMKKIMITVLMTTLLLVSFAGCGKKEEDLVQADLVKYIETDLAGIKNEETAAINRYNEVSTQVASMERKDIIAAFDNEIIPNYTTFYNNLLNVKPSTAEVTALKQTYADGAKLQLDGLTALAQAIKDNNSEAAVAANETISQGKTKIEEHRANVMDLASKHNVTLKTSAAEQTSEAETTEAAQ